MYVRCDNIADDLGDQSPMFPPSNTPTEQYWYLSYLIRQPQGMTVVPRKISPFLISMRSTIGLLRHPQDITITTPRRIADICLSHAEGALTIADSKSTSLSFSRCSSDYFPNPLRCIAEYSAKCRWYLKWNEKPITRPNPRCPEPRGAAN